MPPPTSEASSLSNKRRKSTIVPAGCTVVLPDDIILEVLHRLPVKSILRFRAVCRSWDALFSSKDFCRLHMATSKPREPKLLVVSLTSSIQVYSCSLSSGPPGDDLLFTTDRGRGNSNLEVVTPSPCYGLTLLFDDVAPAYYVCNPATRAITRLPAPYSYPLERHSIGLGFDVDAMEYKVVRLINWYSRGKEALRCDVCTPGADRWRPAAGEVPLEWLRLASSAVFHASLNNVPPVFANGFLHWLINPSLLLSRPRVAIISFSVVEETFGSVPSLPFWGSNLRPRSQSQGEHLAVMDDQVCIVRNQRGSGALEIWGLLDYGSGDWSLNHRIDLCGNIGRKLGEPIVVRVIGSVGNCRSGTKIVIATSEQCFNYKIQEKVHTYDPRCQVLQDIRCVTETYSFAARLIPGSRFSFFEETLAPVHKSDQELPLQSTLPKETKETTTPN